MSDLTSRKMRGPVRTLRKEHAEWDSSQGTWQVPRGVSTVTFRRDGQVSEGESHNPDGSVARWARVYDGAGRIIEEQSWKDGAEGGAAACAPRLNPDGWADGSGLGNPVSRVALAGRDVLHQSFLIANRDVRGELA
jgi:hypothetical protein